ncbi:MAG: protein kinase [Acidobacteria bacterium]|nr:protein kinase [Acidobacteriota bacterium]
MIGEVVTHYRIVDRIGEGGMGVVYRAEDTRLGRQVAVKFLSEKLLADPLAIERFQREARAASSLNHPNICAIYDIGSHNGLPFLVMELLSGTTLRRRVATGPLPLDLLLDLGAQAADALSVAHAAGIIHRDIKSANIFVTERGQIKILDFGLAKLARTHTTDQFAATTLVPPEPQATETGQTIGTLTCMSPEQARGDDLDHRTDLFSFGVVLYEMATGREPFSGKTPALIFDAILRQHPTRPTDVNPTLPAELDHIIYKALEKDRELRYQTAAELRADLRRLKRESDGARASIGRPASGPSATAGVSPAVPTPAENFDETHLAMPGTPAAAPAARGIASGAPLPAPPASGRAGTGLDARTPGTGGWHEPSGAGTATPPAAARRWLLGAVSAVVVLTVAGVLYLGRGVTAADSVAVLPFSATGGTAGDTEYLTDGITETLINGLAQLPDLRVSARSVVFRYKGKNVDAQQVGRELNVNTVVTGHVTVRGDRLIIQSELVNVADGTQLWGQLYNRPQADLLAVQDEIAQEILDKVQPRLSGEDRRRVTKRYTDNADAYQAYLQGRFFWNKGTIDGYKQSINYYQQAIGRDPKYALAYTGLADSYLLLGSYWVEMLPEAKSAALQALALDASLAEAHVALGHIRLLLDWDWIAADAAFTQGLALNGNSALAHSQYAKYLMTVGRTADAVAEGRRALALDPMSPLVNSDLGWYLLFAGDTAEAIAQLRKTLDLDANSLAAHRSLGLAYSEGGQHGEAIAELKQALTLSENSPVVLGYLGLAYARAHDRAQAEGVLRDLGALAARTYVPSSAVALVHTGLGDSTRALDALEKAYEEHDFGITQIRTAPWYGALRNDPRFTALLARLGLSQ